MSSEPGERSVEDVLAEMGAVTGHHGGDLHAVGEFRGQTTKEQDTDSESAEQGTTPEQGDTTQDAEDIPAAAAPADITPAESRAYARKIGKRLERAKLWTGQAENTRDDLFEQARAARKAGNGWSKPQMQHWVYSELDRMYPPLDAREGDTVTSTDDQGEVSPGPGSGTPADDGAIQGLGTIPEDWPELPANSSLAADVAWVQANRLRIVEENPGRATIVRLGRALSPAPSWSALGWLETSIRSYAKFVDVAAKATSGADDEAAVMRHERRAIEDVPALLDEMRGDA